MLLTDWLSLLARNRFRVHPTKFGLAATVTVAAFFNTKMRLVQTAVLGRKIATTPLGEDPVFILGHWRSGTTYLHELLRLDRNFVTPTTYQCFSPNHFLLTEALVTRLLWFLVPEKRPMDNVAAGWNEPQEDEFALCALGLPSPYLRMAFPNSSPRHLEYLNMRGIGDDELARWKQQLQYFLRCLAVRSPGRVVLKSPTHTGRIAMLARLFPTAKFIHITRDPYVIFPSTMRLWSSLDDAQSLQVPDHSDLQEYVLQCFEIMYQGFHEGLTQVDPRRVHHIRYEDLVADPVTVLCQTYEHLELGSFQDLRAAVEAAVQTKADYQTNRYQLPAELEAIISARWHDYITRYNYCREPSRVQAAHQ
jgi:hypothetical protein